MNYLDAIARRIEAEVDSDRCPDGETDSLYRLYAVLLLAKGVEVDAADVHNAWSAWMAERNPNHESLRPFNELSLQVQQLDEHFVAAIRKAAAALFQFPQYKPRGARGVRDDGMQTFEVDAVYKRSQLHDEYGGSRQSGISPSAKHPYVFLFTGSTGEQYGYHDGWVDTDTFHYFGGGRIGDMELSRGNRAIQLHEERGKQLHLFEMVKPKGYVRYIGEVRYVRHFWKEASQDFEGKSRNAIIFELQLVR